MPEPGATRTPLPPPPPDLRPSTPWHVARRAARIAGAARTVPVTDTPLRAAAGATLGAALVSAVDVPALDSAAMDGYAVAGEGPWTLVGRLLAGAPGPGAALAPGQAVEIATGAPVPAGTRAVLPYERAHREEDTVRGPAEEGRHVRPRGEVASVGTTAALRGAPVTPALLGLAAALGHDSLPVARPVVHALVTGDEVVRSGPALPGTVRDAIGPMLPGVVAWAGGRLERTVAVPDDRRALAAALHRSARTADLVAVCGSTSAGPADHLRACLRALRARQEVDGVACRPGHPQSLAVLPSGTVVVGLPGNPQAALVAALTLLVPALAAATGRPDPTATGRRVRLAEAPPARPDTTLLVPVRVEGAHATPIPHRGSADLGAAAVADGYAVIPPGYRQGRVELLGSPG
ncbi:Molybdopterin molybdenumtransferase [Nocardiopsis dassonvillei]|uniref:molybdopterin molybdotransferase MoeA n=1 Tax=Nocardiopsis dassonvillei TaxID=2014 RepID=UPI003F54523E